MKCKHCGNEIQGATQELKVGGIGVLFFIFPIVGWVFYFVWKKDEPGKALKASVLAWMGFSSGFVLIMFIGMIASFMVPRFAGLDGAAKAAACQQNQAALESACAIYYANAAIAGDPKYPDTLEDLFIEGLIDEVPMCPEGVPYHYDNRTGTVTCTQSSGGHSHMR